MTYQRCRNVVITWLIFVLKIFPPALLVSRLNCNLELKGKKPQNPEKKPQSKAKKTLANIGVRAPSDLGGR